MKNTNLFLVLLLSACAITPQPGVNGKTPGSALEHRKSAKPEPEQPQRPVPVETQQPDMVDQGEPLPKKSEHNIEED